MLSKLTCKPKKFREVTLKQIWRQKFKKISCKMLKIVCLFCEKSHCRKSKCCQKQKHKVSEFCLYSIEMLTHFLILMLHSHLQHHNDTIIETDARRKTQEGRRKKTSLTIYLPLTLLQGFERVVQGLHVRGCWRLNINFIFWPPLLMTVTLCLSCSPDAGVHSIGGFRGPPSVGCSFPYHIWSLAVWNSTGNCFGTQLNSII